jgi:predicted metalloprotease
VRRRMLPTLALLVVMLTFTSACAKEAKEDPLSVEGDSGFQVDDNLDDSIDGQIAPDTGLGSGEAPSSDEVVQAALTDVDAFWGREYKKLYGSDYEPISGGFWPYGPDSEQPPCGNPPPDYSDIAENAFYCPSDDLVAWDDVNLIPNLYDEFGGFTLGIVFAHEFGHAIQTRAGIEGDTIMTELQADCFAGAWTADVAEGNSDFFKLELSDLDKAIAGFLELRDSTGTDAVDPAAHGTGFDRIGAYTEGFEQGLKQCKQYPALYDSGDLVIVESPFTDEADFERGGNLPLDEIVPLATDDLQQFWGVLFGELGQTWTNVTAVTPVDPENDEITCGDQTYSGDVLVNASFYCVSNDTIYLDAVNLVPALYDIGDYAVATELARQFAYAAQVRLGNLDNTKQTNLQADCYAGLYASSGFTGNRGDDQLLVLSPGDLDEAVIAFLATSDTDGEAQSDTETVSVGSAFERFDAYRSGFLSGVDACNAILDQK